MTKKLMLGIFLVSFLLLTNLAFSGEKSSPAPAIAKMDAVSSDCDCLKKDTVPPSPELRADVLAEKPSLMPQKRGGCLRDCYWAFGHRWCFWVCGMAY